jgi:hypothetical protein
VVFERLAVRASDYRAMLESYRSSDGADVQVGGFRLQLLGRLAVGHSTDVFVARRAARLSERLILKVLRSAADESLLHDEQRALEALADSHEPGTEYFSALLPQRAFTGALEGAGFAPTFAVAFRQPAGFNHTLLQLRQRFPSGVDPRHAVWLWRRALELLGWVHRSGWAHGAVLPAHVLLDAREHSVRLVGFSCAGRPGAALAALDAEQTDFYPLADATSGQLSFETDLTMLARTLLFAIGGTATSAPSTLPGAFAQLLVEQAQGAGAPDALAVAKQVKAVAEQCFGPPKFVKLELR